MNGRGDYYDEMSDLPLDDVELEALLRGESPAGDPQLATVAAFVRDMRASGTRPAPAPSPALAALFRQGVDDVPVVPVGRRAPGVVAGWRRRLAVAGIGLGVMVTGVVGAGAAGLLPGPVERVVGGVVEALTPLELPEQGSDVRDAVPHPGRSGDAGTASTTSGGQPAGSTAAPGGTTQSSAPGPSSARSGTSSTAPGSTATTQVGGPGVTPPPVPVGPTLPSTSTTLPTTPPLPSPTLPNAGTLPVTTPTSAPGLPVSVPRLPR